MLGEKIRNYGFWAVDFLKKGGIREHYLDIARAMEAIAQKDANTQEDSLEKLLLHASATSPFYRPYKNTPLEDFPIIDKNVIRENYKSILSTKYGGENLHQMSTSGSTGTPLTVSQDKEKRNRVLAELIYFGEKCGYNIGERNVFFRTWTETNKKSSLRAFAQNQVLWDNSSLDKSSLEKIRQDLKQDRKLKCILGYASSLDVLARYLLDKGENPSSFGLKVIISGAEALSETARANLKQVFDCNVVSRYSNQENGILAQEFEDNIFVINSASYHIEFLKLESDEPAQPKELARVVITDLYNYAMPVIRYDIGDVATFEEHPQYGRVITSIGGRMRDFVYDTKGRLVAPSAITVNMWKFHKLKQFQFIQDTKTQYTLKVNGAQGIYGDNEFIDMIKGVMGKEADVRIEHVNGIPFLSSGKFQQVLCQWSNE